MDCEELKEILSGYVDGEARGDEGRVVEKHLAACAACRKLARRMRAVGAGVGRIESDVSPGFRETLFARMEREGLLAPRRSLFAYSLRWAAVPLAAAALLAVVLLMPRETGIRGPSPPAQRGPEVAERAPQAQVARPAHDARVPEAATAAAGRAAVAHDGSDLSPEEREIVAYIEVLEDPAALDEPSEIDDLDLVAPAARKKG